MIQPKNVLVTGASTGIGNATARYLGSNGFHVFAGLRSPHTVDSFPSNENITPILLDVSKSDDVARAVEAVQAHGTLDALINNAGINHSGPLMDVTPETLHQHLEVNLMGVHRVTKACFNLIDAANGRIVMVSSFSGVIATPFIGPYNASKAALESYTDTLRREIAITNDLLKVILIEPGPTKTEMFEKGRSAAREYDDPDSPFTKPFQQLTKLAEERNPKGDPNQIAKTIHDALTAANPKIRYYPEMPKIAIPISKLPAKWLDILMNRSIKRILKKET